MFKNIEYKWYILLLSCLTIFFGTGLQRYTLPVLFDEISKDLNLSLLQIGTIWGMDPLGGVFVSLFIGMLIDKFGIKRSVVTISILVGITGMLRGFSSNFITLLVIMLLFGLVVSTTPTVFFKVIAVWFEGRNLGMANGILMAFNHLGGMTSSMTSATILSPLLNGWRNVIILFAFPPIILGFLWLVSYKEDRKPSFNFRNVNKPSIGEALAHVIRIKDVWIASIIQAGAAGMFVGVTGYLPIYLRNLGWETGIADSSLTILIGTIAFASILVPMLSDRFGSRKLLLVPLQLIVCSILLMFPFIDSYMLYILIILFGFFFGGIPPLIISSLVELKEVGSSYAGTAIGLCYTFAMLGSFISAPLGNSTASIHPALPFVIWGAMVGIVSFGYLFLESSKVHNQ